MKISVAIATAGRAELTAQTVRYLSRQTRKPHCVYVCPAREQDFDASSVGGLPFDLKVVRGGVGLPAQRNVILEAASEDDAILFLDDDFVADAHFVAELDRLFEAHPDVVMLTGDVIADGANGPGIDYADAVSLVERGGALPDETVRPVYNGYGCNMAIRMEPVRRLHLRFDEVLPLYGWWEDVDFSRRLAPSGRILKSNRLRGVHMGAKSGRTPGVRLGYSQVANIAYMVKKGSVSFQVGLVRIARNVIANSIRQFAPEPWVDRHGRFKGNLIGIADVMRGRVDPQRILRL